jgi:hypothetical protein
MTTIGIALELEWMKVVADLVPRVGFCEHSVYAIRNEVLEWKVTLKM